VISWKKANSGGPVINNVYRSVHYYVKRSRRTVLPACGRSVRGHWSVPETIGARGAACVGPNHVRHMPEAVFTADELNWTELCLFVHHIHTGQAPQYLPDCVSAVSALSGRYRLRSTGSADYVLPRTRTRFGERGFSYCGPAAWNTLPSDLHDISDTGTFSERLKSVLYDRAYHWLLLALLDVSYSGALQISRWLIDW